MVDRDYTGNIGVVMFNHDKTQTFMVTKGMAIAQAILERNYKYYCYKVDTAELDLRKTARGARGLGCQALNDIVMSDNEDND